MPCRTFRFGDYEADFNLYELRKCGTRIALQHKPFRVLELLLIQAGELVSREQLFAYLWPDSHVGYQRGLTSAVNSLRHVLGESSRTCQYIETRPGLGYRFVAPVREVSAQSFQQASEAYQDCLKGRYLLDRMAEAEIHKAIAYFHSATADEACSPLAHAGMADAYCQLACVGSICPSTLSAKARECAEYALQRRPDLSDAHVSCARVKLLFEWDCDAAGQNISDALKVEPYSLPAQTLRSWLLSILGNHQEALEVCRESLSSDPLSFPANLQFATSLYANRDFSGSVEQCWKILSLAASFAPAQLVLALAYAQLRMYDEAIIEFQNAGQCSTCRVPALSGLSAVLATAGQREQAAEIFEELCSLAGNRYIAHYWYAAFHVACGQCEQAMDCLAKSFERRDPALLCLNFDARFDCLRSDSRFERLLLSRT